MSNAAEAFANAKGERFAVSLLGEDGAPTERVTVQVGMDGLFIMSADAARTLRKFPLSHIARWAIPPSASGSALVLYTRTPVDVEEVTLTLSGTPATIRAVLDTLTCCCMQMVELLESEREREAEEGGGGRRHRHSSGGFRRRKQPPPLPAAEDVEFWRDPEKEGWLQSQGEHIKTWRRRWHVLKQGYLFRFASERDASAGPSSRPRGVVDLSKVTDVSSGGGGSYSAATIRLSTPQGASISYLADSETEAVEWISALEGSVARIVRAVAGVDDDDGDGDDDARHGRSTSAAGRSSNRANGSSGSGRPSRPASGAPDYDGANAAAARLAAAGGNPLVSVVNYDGAADAPRASYSSPSRASSRHAEAPTAPAYGGGAGVGYDAGGGGDLAGGAVFGGGPTFAGVAGVAGVASSAPAPAPYAGGGGYPAVSDPAVVATAASYEPYRPYQEPAAAAAPVAAPAAAAPAPAAAASSSAPPPLPHPWQVHYTSDGRAYYFNTATQATQWEPPPAASLV